MKLILINFIFIVCSIIPVLAQQAENKKNHYIIQNNSYVEIKQIKLFVNTEYKDYVHGNLTGEDHILNKNNPNKRIIKFTFDTNNIKNQAFWISGHPAGLKVLINNNLIYTAVHKSKKQRRIKTMIYDIPQKFLKQQNNEVLIIIDKIDQYTGLDYFYLGSNDKLFFSYMLYFILLGAAIFFGFVTFCCVIALYFRMKLLKNKFLLYISLFLLSANSIFFSRSTILLYVIDIVFISELLILQYFFFSSIILICFITDFLAIKKVLIKYINKILLIIATFLLVIFILERISMDSSNITFNYLLPLTFVLLSFQIIYSIILFSFYNSKSNFKKIEFKLICLLYFIVLQDFVVILDIYIFPYFINPRDSDYLIAIPIILIVLFKVSKLLVSEFFSSQEKVILIEANKTFNILSENDIKYLYFYYKYCSKKKYAYRMAKKLDVTPDSVNRILQRIKIKLKLTEVKDLANYKDNFNSWYKMIHNSENNSE